MLVLILPLLIALVVIYLIQFIQYIKSEYYQQTHNSYLSVRLDAGRVGEYYTYQDLKPLAGYKRFLFNIYLPKENGETSEIDVVLLHESGIYVLESKNYSGWIFGTESQLYWTQTLPNGQNHSHKEKFYNPILQNKGHLKWIQKYLDDETLPFYSYIVFSERCTLKNVVLTSGKHFVVNRNNLYSAVRQNAAQVGQPLSPEKIDALFEKLYPLSQVEEAQKILHIQTIQQKKQNHSSQNLAHTAAEQKEAPNAAAQKEGEKQCPRCGGQLVMRTASNPQYQGKKFWGCSNFPRCKYREYFPEEMKTADEQQP